MTPTCPALSGLAEIGQVSFYEPMLSTSRWSGRKLLPAVRVVRVYKIADMVGSVPRLPVPGLSNRNHGSTTQGLARRTQLSPSEDARPLRLDGQQRLSS